MNNLFLKIIVSLFCVNFFSSNLAAKSEKEQELNRVYGYLLASKLSYLTRDKDEYVNLFKQISGLVYGAELVNLKDIPQGENRPLGIPNDDVQFEALLFPNGKDKKELVISIRGKDIVGNLKEAVKLAALDKDEIEDAYKFHQERNRVLGIKPEKGTPNFVKELVSYAASNDDIKHDLIENKFVPILRDVDKLLSSPFPGSDKINAIRFVGHSSGGYCAKLVALAYNNHKFPLKKRLSGIDFVESTGFSSPGLRKYTAIRLLKDTRTLLQNYTVNKEFDDFTDHHFYTNNEVERHYTLGHSEDFFFNLGNTRKGSNSAISLAPEGPHIILNLGPDRYGRKRNESLGKKIAVKVTKAIVGFSDEDFVPNKFEEIRSTFDLLSKGKLTPPQTTLRNNVVYLKFVTLYP